MTSYTNSRESVPLPGSFPTDDMTPTTEHPSLTPLGSQSQHNKLHKPEDPRGWSDEEKAARGHQYTDSGIGLSDPNVPNSEIHGRANQGAFNSNNNALESHDPKSGAATTTRPTDYYTGQSKPGVMTGAHSRIGNSNNSQNSSKPITQDSATKEQAATGIGAVGPATGIATAATSTDPDHSEQNLRNDDRNIVRNGLRQTSNVEHKDPYWGDVSYGTGIYNGVTGHGSSETPAKGSIHPHDQTKGHEQQRAFPLSNPGNAAQDETDHQNSSRFKEGLAESGAGAGSGVAASELTEKHRDHLHEKSSKEKEPTSHKRNDSDTKKESKIAGLFHRDHKRKDSKPEKYDTKEKKLQEGPLSKDNSPLKEREAGAALAAATAAYGAKDKHDKKHKESESGLKENKSNALYEHPNEKIGEPTKKAEPQASKDPFVAAGYSGHNSQNNAKSSNNAYPASEDVTTRGHPFTSQVPEKTTERNDSRLGYGLAAAGSGAGAGYAAHEYANRDSTNHKDQSSQPTYNTPTAATSKVPEQSSNSGYTIGQPQLGVGSGTTAPTQFSSNGNSSPANTSHHDKYNVLADGTPSGISIGDHYGDKKNTVTSSPDTGYNITTKDSHTGAKAAAAGAGIVGAAGAARYAGHRDSDKIPASESHQTTAPSSREVHEPYMETTGTGANTRTSTSLNRHGEYNILHDGTPSGINTSDHHGDKKNVATSAPTGLRKPSNASSHAGVKAPAAVGAAGVVGAGAVAGNRHRNNEAVSSPVTRDQQPDVASASNASNAPTTAATTTTSTGSGHSRNRSSTDSSRGGKYNVLSSGTPSGINIGDHDHLGHKSLDGNHSTSNYGNIKSSAPAVDAGAAPKRDITSAATAAGVGATAAAAAAPTFLKSGDRVVHRCRKCGEENDITGYFQK
ncbi:hypothetical protein F4776DRAFT_600128 [Hypoxylon sp. NC0597]|nr:hypothetical protein F4776DRAFT_600128 [Hypoxylon sp. NC0597]